MLDDAPLPGIFEHKPQEEAPAAPEEGVQRPRRARRPRHILDETNRYTHSFMKSWSDNYLDNMSLASQRLANLKHAREAKPLATSLVLTQGINGPLIHPDLAALFSGAAILSHLGGVTPEPVEPVEPAQPEEARDIRASSHLASDLGHLDINAPPSAPPSEVARACLRLARR